MLDTVAGAGPGGLEGRQSEQELDAGYAMDCHGSPQFVRTRDRLCQVVEGR
jgi:hypothetical protein